MKNKTFTLDLSNPGDLAHVAALETEPHRPAIKVWLDDEPDGETAARGFVVIGITALWGQSARYVEMSADEARRLARHLNQTASSLEELEQENA